MPQLKNSALTLKSNGINKVLETPVLIIVPDTSRKIAIKAIWDTGATGSVITKAVAESLGLIATGMSQVHTANGLADQFTYVVDILLPNDETISKVTVTEVEGLSGGCEALIGMDVITTGDFSVTNHKGCTWMSFRSPSCHAIDYVAHNVKITPKNSKTGSVGSNFTPPRKRKR